MHTNTINRLRSALAILFLACAVFAARNAVADETNSFPDVNEVIGDRVFTNKSAREVFFLQQIRQRYPAYWPALLAANIAPGDYLVTPEKMGRFIEEVGVAAENSDDPAAITSIAAVVTNANYYTNAPHPEVQQAVAASLIKIGPAGALALAHAFNQTHYRLDPESLEDLADAIGKLGVFDLNISTALAATAFTFTATNGGSYPRCTAVAVRNLLCLTNGVVAVRDHLNTNEVFRDPGRFQPVIDAIAEAHAVSLATNLEALLPAINNRFKTLASGPNPYRDDLTDLQTHLEKTIESLQTKH